MSPPTRLGNILQAFEGRPANRSGSRVAGGGRSSLWPRTRRPATPQTTPYSAREIASTPDGLHCAQCADLGRAEDHRGPVLQVVLLASIPSLNRLPMPSPQHGPTTDRCGESADRALRMRGRSAAAKPAPRRSRSSSLGSAHRCASLVGSAYDVRSTGRASRPRALPQPRRARPRPRSSGQRSGLS